VQAGFIPVFRTPSSVTPASLTPPPTPVARTRTATLLRNSVWVALFLALLAGVLLFLRYGSDIVPMVGATS
jgi:type VI protein secretion system component VasF